MEETRVKDEERVSRLLSSLPAADAPANFESMVRTRIAEQRPSGSTHRPIFWLVLKFSAPLILLALLGGFLVISNNGSLNVGMVPPVDSPGVDPAVLNEKVPSNELAVNSPTEPVRQPTNDRNIEIPKTSQSSQDKALSNDDKTIFPPGVDPRRVADQVPVLEVLNMLGIEASCSTPGCKVVSIRPNSIAGKSGIAEGDTVEAIDGKSIGVGVTVEGGVFSLRILRAGKRSTITLNAN